MKVLLTGADGFIGSHLAEALVKQGHTLTALVMYNSFDSWGWLDDLPAEIKSEINVVSGDVRDPRHMSSIAVGQEAICHLAALIAIPYSYVAPDQYVQTNIQGTLNLLNAARSANVAKFLHTSTSEVYGTAKYVPIDENHPLQGQSPYSASKIGADQLTYSYHSAFELNTLIVRPFNTFGPRQSTRAVIPTIISQVVSNSDHISLGSLTPTRDFTYIDDTVSGFIRALDENVRSGETVNLGTGFEISIGDLAKVIFKLMGRELNVAEDSVRQRPSGSEVERLLSDNSKAKELLNWSPSLSGLEGLTIGLQKTIEWFTQPENLKKYRTGKYTI